MSDVSIDGGDDLSGRSLSRRTALKAGVAAGVGVAAWSGATITSLGGTPAYAVACSQSIFLDLSGGCRNTDSSVADAFRYHPLKRDLPTGFTIIPGSPADYPPEGTDCSKVNPLPILHWDHTVLPNLSCRVHLEIYTNGIDNCTSRDASKRIVDVTVPNPPAPPASSTDSTDGNITIPMTCQGLTQKPNGGTYTIYAVCATTGAPDDCFVQ